MKINVSTLLRDFPKVRRTVLSGEDVIVQTREGDLRLTAEKPREQGILGCMRNRFGRVSDDVVGPTTTDADWKPSL